MFELWAWRNGKGDLKSFRILGRVLFRVNLHQEVLNAGGFCLCSVLRICGGIAAIPPLYRYENCRIVIRLMSSPSNPAHAALCHPGTLTRSGKSAREST